MLIVSIHGFGIVMAALLFVTAIIVMIYFTLIGDGTEITKDIIIPLIVCMLFGELIRLT